MLHHRQRRLTSALALVTLLVGAPAALLRGQDAGQRPAAGKSSDHGGGSHASFREADALSFQAANRTVYGDWQADVSLDAASWRPDQRLTIDVVLRFPDAQLAAMSAGGTKADKLCLLVTAERTFDADGWMRLASDERMSTLLTPTGVAIEGGVQGAATNRYGYQFRSPFDQFVTIAAGQTEAGPPGTRLARFKVSAPLPANLPPGLYRLRFDIGVVAGARNYNFNGYAFAARPFSSEAGTCTYFYSPVIPASGIHVSGRRVSGERIEARCPWLLLASYNSNGYRGVVADEDKGRFAMSDRNLVPDEVVLPMYDESGATRLSYSLEPQFPADSIDANQNIAWDWTTGQWSVRVAGPDGSVADLGTANFVAKSGNGPTTKVAAMTAWRPQAYGRYTVTATGWIADRQGRRYEGGGTYRFWIAKRMTLATATFQGMPYLVGSSYGRDIQFNPAVPADVQVTARLFVNSDSKNVRSISYSGTATAAGLFGAAQGMKPFPLDAPGEYHAQILASYRDADGHLWVCPMRHAGVVYPEDSRVIARGKKRQIGGRYADRGETRFEGYVDADGEQHLDHITFPYLAGDVLLIASEGQGANKIEPVLTYQLQGDTSPWDTRLNGVGTTNLRINTSNGYSPHLYPEYITDLEYYYAAAPRPGFMGRFLVADSNVRAPYWPVSPQSFGGQIAASPNGDAAGEIYRLIGGVVLRRVGQAPMYSGYIASAMLLPKGTNNNRIVAAGSEDLLGPLGQKARFFLVGLRPGTAYEVGSTFRPAVQIDPIVPASIRFVLTYPDGRQQVADGLGDRFGSFAGPTSWPLDVPGVYRYQVTGRWNGYEGRMPGLPESGGNFFVHSRTRPTGAAGLSIDGASQRTFSATGGVTITGTSGAASVQYTLITPGAVIDQGEIPVRAGRFSYTLDPAAVHAKAPVYDIASITSGKPQLGRVLHLTFFSEERAAGGVFCDVSRVILRGTTAISARGLIPATAPLAPSVAAPAGAGPASSSAPRRELLAFGTGVPAGVARGLGLAGAAPGSPLSQRFGGPAPASAEAGRLADLRTADTEIDRMLRSGELLLLSSTEDPYLPGHVHERLQQVHEGVPVIGGQVTRQLEEGTTVSTFGSIYHDIVLALEPAIDANQAWRSLERGSRDRVAPAAPPTLAVLPSGEGYLLVWRIDVVTEGKAREERLVAAATGEVLAGLGEGGERVQALARQAAQRAVRGWTGAMPAESVTGVGAAAAPRVERAFARALAHLLPSGASPEIAAACTVQSAIDLFGPDDAVTRAIRRAWRALADGSAGSPR